MSTAAQSLIQIIENIFPKFYAEDWDNCGIQVGNPNIHIRRVMVALDVTEVVVNWAISNEIQMIVSHHPLIFSPPKKIDTSTDYGKIIEKVLKNDILVYSAHTNMDNAPDGINDYLASLIGLGKTDILKTAGEEKLYKIVVFTPKAHANAVRDAMSREGAGYVGNYSYSTFSIDGKATFMPMDGASPFIGEKGRIEFVDEVRTESIVEQRKLRKVIAAIKKVHPYEEVAYDIIELPTQGIKYGTGRIGYLNEKIYLKDFLTKIKEIFNLDSLRYAGDLDRKIKKIAICGGAGGSFIKNAVFQGADIILTGDVKYHEVLDAVTAGVAVADICHYESENIYLPHMVYNVNEMLKNEKLDIELVYWGEKKGIYRTI